jgi:hypothetical protein
MVYEAIKEERGKALINNIKEHEWIESYKELWYNS